MPRTRPAPVLKPLDVFKGLVAEVLAVNKRRALVLDTAGALRYAEDGAERPSPIDVSMPGMALAVAEPMVHRRLDAAEATHSAAARAAVTQVAIDEGPAVERAMVWKGAGAAYDDLARHGRVVVWRYGMNNAFNEKLRLCRAADERAAAEVLADIRAKPPAGYKPTSPFYVDGRGCVIRSYAHGSERELRGVVDNEARRFGGEVLATYASAAEAEAAHDRLEGERFAAGWFAFGVEIDRRSLSAADRAKKRR